MSRDTSTRAAQRPKDVFKALQDIRTAERRARTREDGPVATAELKRRILEAYDAERPHVGLRMSDLGHAAWPDWPFASPQGAARAVSKIIRAMVWEDRTLSLDTETHPYNAYVRTAKGREAARKASPGDTER